MPKFGVDILPAFYTSLVVYISLEVNFGWLQLTFPITAIFQVWQDECIHTNEGNHTQFHTIKKAHAQKYTIYQCDKWKVFMFSWMCVLSTKANARSHICLLCATCVLHMWHVIHVWYFRCTPHVIHTPVIHV